MKYIINDLEFSSKNSIKECSDKILNTHDLGVTHYYEGRIFDFYKTLSKIDEINRVSIKKTIGIDNNTYYTVKIRYKQDKKNINKTLGVKKSIMNLRT